MHVHEVTGKAWKGAQTIYGKIKYTKSKMYVYAHFFVLLVVLTLIVVSTINPPPPQS